MSPRSRILVSHLAVSLGVLSCERAPTSNEWSEEDDAVAAAALVAREPGMPVPGLTPEQLALFERGRLVFEKEWPDAEGLGPTFNAEGCANCHGNPVTGGFSGRGVTHATAWDGQRCDDLSAVGGPVFQENFTAAAIAAFGDSLEAPDPRATAIAERSTPDLFGFGLLDAVLEATLRLIADPNDRNRDGISGRVHRTADGRVGRFGRKGQVPALDAFNAEAWIMEQGITNPIFPFEQPPNGRPFPDGVDPTPEPELSQDSLNAANAFIKFLAPPARLPLTAEGVRGGLVFGIIGCAKCHIPVLRTGKHPVTALSEKWVAAYTDLLLHDMGPDLADICFNDTQPQEFRTEPLMGLRFSTEFLHDGRVRTVNEAILLHGGEAQTVRNRYSRLSERDRNAVLAFLSGL
jgi:CxxC motif-containing protein (DUF1111 family)